MALTLDEIEKRRQAVIGGAPTEADVQAYLTTGKPIAKNPQDRSLAGDVAAAAGRGWYGAQKMLGGAAKAFSPVGSALYEKGQEVELAAQADLEQPSVREGKERGFGASTLIKGVEAVAQMAPVLAASMIPGVGQVLGPGVAATMYGGSTYQGTKERMLKQEGLDDAYAAANPNDPRVKKANMTGLATGVVQGVGDSLSTAVGGKFITATMPNLGKTTAQSLLKTLKNPGSGAAIKFLKGWGIAGATEAATEPLQDETQAYIERQAGLKDAPKFLEQFKDSAQGGLGAALLLGPIAGLSHANAYRKAKAINIALTDPSVDPALRDLAANMVAEDLAKTDPQAATNFQTHAFDAINGEQITGTAPYGLNLDDESIITTQKTPAPAAEASPVLEALQDIANPLTDTKTVAEAVSKQIEATTQQEEEAIATALGIEEQRAAVAEGRKAKINERLATMNTPEITALLESNNLNPANRPLVVAELDRREAELRATPQEVQNATTEGLGSQEIPAEPQGTAIDAQGEGMRGNITTPEQGAGIETGLGDSVQQTAEEGQQEVVPQETLIADEVQPQEVVQEQPLMQDPTPKVYKTKAAASKVWSKDKENLERIETPEGWVVALKQPVQEVTDAQQVVKPTAQETTPQFTDEQVNEFLKLLKGKADTKGRAEVMDQVKTKIAKLEEQVDDGLVGAEEAQPLLDEYTQVVAMLEYVEQSRGVKATKQETPKLSRATASTTGLDKPTLTKLAEPLVGRAKLKIVENPSELPLRAPSDAKGLYHKGTVYLVRENIADEEMAREVIAHEVIGHYGLVGFFGSKLNKVLDNIYAKNTRVQKYAEEWVAVNPDVIKEHKLNAEAVRYLSIEEALARMAGERRSVPGVMQLVAAVQKLLRAVGLNKWANKLESKTDSEALKLLKKAELFAKDGITLDKDLFNDIMYPRFLSTFKKEVKDENISTARILAGAAEESKGSRISDAKAELGRLVEDKFYDRAAYSPRVAKKREAAVLRKWAAENGLIKDPAAFDKPWAANLNPEGKPIQGNEHDVVFNGDGTVTKRNHVPGTYHESYRELFDRVEIFNYLFGAESALTLTGFQDVDGVFMPEFQQKDLGGTKAKIANTQKMLLDAGFEEVGEKTTAYRLPGTDIIITDVFGDNTRQVGDVAVPMDYVIFYGDRAKEWLAAQTKKPMSMDFSESEFDKAFDAATKDHIAKFARSMTSDNPTPAVKSLLKPAKRIMKDWATNAYRYLMPLDRVLTLAASQKEYAPIANQLKEYMRLKKEKSGYVQRAMSDGWYEVAEIQKVFKTKADMKKLEDLVFNATLWELHADGRESGWTAESWGAAGMLETTGKSLEEAKTALAAQYANLTDTQKAAHKAMLEQITKMYEDGRKASIAPYAYLYGDQAVKDAEAYNVEYYKAQDESYQYKRDIRIPEATPELKNVAEIMRNIDRRFPKLRGDYFPLMRFGDIMVRVSQMDENGELGKRTSLHMFDSQQEALDFVENTNANPADGLHAVIESNKQMSRDAVNIPAELMDKLRGLSDRRFKEQNPEASQDDIDRHNAEVESMIRDAEALRVSMMPRLATEGNKLKREGVKGFNKNVLKVFTNYVTNHANANASLIYGTKIERNFRDMANEIKGYTSEQGYDPKAALDMSDLQKSLYDSEKTSAKTCLNKAVKAAGKMSFLWYLSSPSIWAVQWSQPFMITIPQLAARHGYTKSLKKYTEAAGRYLAGDFSDENLTEFNRKNNVGEKIYDLIEKRRQALPNELTAIDARIKELYDGVTDPKEKRLAVLKVLSLQGMIDLSASHEFRELAQSSNVSDTKADKMGRAFSTLNDKASFFMRHSETGSRRAAAITAFELALEKGNIADANDYAVNVINDTLYNMSSENRGEAWRGNAGHIFGQFQFFRLHTLGKMLQLMKNSYGSEYRDVINSESATEAEKTEAQKRLTEARKELAFMTVTSLGLAGAGGTPIALVLGNSGMSALFGAIGFLFGDDDEPWDLKRDFEQFVRENLGDTAGNTFLKGIPYLFGMDISKRIGLGSMGDIVNGEPPAGVSATAKANWYAGRLLGPAWGIASDGIKAADSLADGDMANAMKYSSPKVVRDFMRMFEISEKGVASGGKTILQAEDVNPMSYALMLVGINPADVSLASEESRYLKNISANLSHRRSLLMNGLAEAVAEGDYDKKQEFMDKINTWSEKQPQLKITQRELATAVRKQLRSAQGVLSPREKSIQEKYGVEGGG